MSAAEIIEKIKRLPPEEQKQVREYVNTDVSTSGSEPAVEFIPREDLERTAKEIFKKHDTLFRKLAQ